MRCAHDKFCLGQAALGTFRAARSVRRQPGKLRTPGVLVLAGALLLAAGGWAGEHPQKLALVNVSLVFEKYDKVPDVQRAIDSKHQAQKDELQKRAQELLERNRELESMYNQAQTEESVFDKVQKLRKDQFHYERELARLNAEIQNEYARRMREVLSDIRVAVRAIAEQGRFDLVLRSPDTRQPGGVRNPRRTIPQIRPRADSRTYLSLVAPQTTAELVERFNRNPVLFGAKTVDITQEVLKKLNEDYRRRSSKAPPPGSKP